VISVILIAKFAAIPPPFMREDCPW